MTAHTLTDAELARLEELSTAAGKGTYSAGDGSAEGKWVAAACNAVPSLVVEVRRLRAENAEVRADMVAVKTKLEPCNDCWTMKILAFEMGISDMHWFFRDARFRLESMKQAEAENAALRERVEALEKMEEVDADA